MERNSPTDEGYKLESQIREAYGRVVYTFTCHNKMVQRLLKKYNRIKFWQIVLSAIATGSFLTIIFYNELIVRYIGALITITLLILNTYTKDFDLPGAAQTHQKTADRLWTIREEYVSLLTDFDLLEASEIMKRRNELQHRTAEVYNHSPRTDSKSYAEAQKSLKVEEEQTFSENEIDVMLPNSIRRNKN